MGKGKKKRISIVVLVKVLHVKYHQRNKSITSFTCFSSNWRGTNGKPNVCMYFNRKERENERVIGIGKEAKRVTSGKYSSGNERGIWRIERRTSTTKKGWRATEERTLKRDTERTLILPKLHTTDVTILSEERGEMRSCWTHSLFTGSWTEYQTNWYFPHFHFFFLLFFYSTWSFCIRITFSIISNFKPLAMMLMILGRNDDDSKARKLLDGDRIASITSSSNS